MLNYSYIDPYLVTYQKPNGEIITRMVKHFYLDIGQTNNSGWKVISIQKYNSDKHRFEEVIPFYSPRYQEEKRMERTKSQKSIKGKIKRIISIIKE